MAGKSVCFRHEIVIRELEGHLIAVNYFLDISEKDEIEKSLGLLEKVAENTYLKKKNAPKSFKKTKGNSSTHLGWIHFKRNRRFAQY